MLLTLLRKVADGLIGLSATIGALALGAEVVVILIDVIGRAFGHPLLGSQDIITMAMIVLVFGAMALCDRQGGHIAVDLSERFLSARVNRLTDAVSAALGAAIFVALAWSVMDSARISVMLNLSTNLLRLPKAWFQYGLSGFALVTAFGMALRAIELTLNTRDVRTERTPQP